MFFKGIDLFSDTLTQPTAEMKQAMISAELGDEQKGEDPTTLKLEEMVANLLGHDAAMFFPSATLSNQIALRLLCDRGDELLAAANCHLFNAEAGGPAVHSGVMAKPIATETGIFTADQVRAQYRWSKGPHYPLSKCLSVENTTNMGGGIAWPLDQLNSVLDVAQELNLRTHLDGARLFNAAVKTNLKPHELASRFDTVTICLSKGLGCAAGAVLAYPKKDFATVRRLKQLMGGSLRQSGILAAAGIYALENHVKRLAVDHQNAQLLAEKMVKEISDIHVETNPPSTNMVFFEWLGSKLTPTQFLEQCVKKGLRFSHVGERRFRAVTHLGITRADIEKAIGILKQIAAH